MKVVLYFVFLSYICQCCSRSIPGAAANSRITEDEYKNDFKGKTGFFKIPKTKRESEVHDILHHFKGAFIEDHINSENIRTKRETPNYGVNSNYTEKDNGCGPRYNFGSSVYHKDVNIENGGSVVNIGTLYIFQYSNGEYYRHIPVPGVNIPPYVQEREPAPP